MEQSAKAFFQQVRNIDKQIDVKYQQLERWKTLATKVTPTLSGAGGGSGGVSRSLENSVEKIVAVQEELEADIAKYTEMAREANAKINGLRDEKQRRCLDSFYLQGKSFEEIAEEMNYSVPGVKKLRNLALRAVDENEKKRVS